MLTDQNKVQKQTEIDLYVYIQFNFNTGSQTIHEKRVFSTSGIGRTGLPFVKQKHEPQLLFCNYNTLCCCPVTQPCLTLCDPMDYSTPGFPVLHCLPEFAQTQVH